MADLDASLGKSYAQRPEDIRRMGVWTTKKLKRRAWAFTNLILHREFLDHFRPCLDWSFAILSW